MLTYQNDTRLTYIDQDGGQNADLGYDDLGRPIVHRWESFDTDDLGEGDLIVGFEHQNSTGTTSLYDRVHNKKIEYKMHDTDNSEMYTYDSAYRLTDPSSSTQNGFRRGEFEDGDRDSMATEDVNYYQDWQLDGLGNWEKEWKDSATAQTRLHSDFNEIVYHGGPVSHWKLNETIGTTASDSVGDNNGTLNNFTGTYWVTGKVGNGLDFDGTEDYIQITESDSSLSTANFGGTENGKVTIAAWVYITDNEHSNIVTDYVGGIRYFSTGCYADEGATTGKLRCMVWDDNAQLNYWPTSTTDVTENAWTHVAFVFEAGIGYRFYIDGEAAGSASNSDLEMFNYTSSNTKYLGKLGSTPFFDGKMDNVMVFNRALSDEEIEALYEAGDTHSSELPMAHDANGNLTRNREGVTIQYDAFNRLKEVTNVDGETVAEYVYDADNRRMQKVVQNDGLPGDSSLNGTTRYYYHGWRVLEERDGSGDIQRQYTYGNYLDEVWTIDDRSGSITVAQLNDTTGSHRHFAHNNTLYHVYGLTDEDGDLVEAYQYDAYGKATVITDGDDGDSIVNFNSNDDSSKKWSSVNNPYHYTGQRNDPETALVYYKNRYYDTALGRFISRDPIGYADGMNLYEYVNSMPTMHYDAYGLQSSGGRWADMNKACQDGCDSLLEGQYKNHICHQLCMKNASKWRTVDEAEWWGRYYAGRLGAPGGEHGTYEEYRKEKLREFEERRQRGKPVKRPKQPNTCDVQFDNIRARCDNLETCESDDLPNSVLLVRAADHLICWGAYINFVNENEHVIEPIDKMRIWIYRETYHKEHAKKCARNILDNLF